MQIQILQENLHKALGMTDKFVSSKPQLPVLANLLLKATNDGFFITATNLETGMKMRVGAKIIEEGSITVPSKIFSEVVGALPSETVDLYIENEQLHLKCGKHTSSFQVISATEFPDFPVKIEDDVKTIKTSVLKKIVDKVGFSASSDDSRPVLTGMLWDVGKKDVRVVSTDGYRLSMLELPLNSVGEIDKTLLLPAFVLREVVKVFAEIGREDVMFSWSEKEKQVFFYTEDAEIVTRVLDGEFPSYKAVIPDDQSIRVVLSKQDLIAAVKMTAIFARESANIIRWKFESGNLQLSANSPQVGGNTALVSYEGTGVEEKEIAFNSRYLLDLCSHIEGERVVFSMTESLRPGVFYEEGEKSEFLHVIMPVRVQN